MAAHPKFADISEAINTGVDNLNKWYRKTDDTDVYFICLALDPKWKLAYAREKWEKDHFDARVERLENVVRILDFSSRRTIMLTYQFDSYCTASETSTPNVPQLTSGSGTRADTHS